MPDESSSIRSHQESFGYSLSQTGRLMDKRMAAALRPLGLAPAQFVVLMHLWETAPLTQANLIGRTNVEQATMVKTLNRMERDGLITRSIHPSDQRAWLIHPSKHARDLERPAKSIGAAVNRQALQGLNEDEQELCRGLLRRVVGNLS